MDENSIVQEISILLRDGRLDRNETIEEVARTLRINRRYLEAIEEGCFDELPGSVYTLGFIRSFGDHVGLDGEDLVRRFKLVSSSIRRRSELDFPEPIPESGIPGGAILFAGLLIVALGYGGWYMLNERDSLLSDLVSPVPGELAEQVQTDVGQTPVPVISDTPPDVAEKEVGDVAVAVARIKPVEPEKTAKKVMETFDNAALRSSSREHVDAITDTEATVATEARVDGPPPEQRPENALGDVSVTNPSDTTTGADDFGETVLALNRVQGGAGLPQRLNRSSLQALQAGTVPLGPGARKIEAPLLSIENRQGRPGVFAEAVTRENADRQTPTAPSAEGVVIVATSDSWVQVRDVVKDAVVISQIMRAGERFSVPRNGQYELQASNVGALEFIIEGEKIAAIGAEGEVGRNIPLDAHGLTRHRPAAPGR